MINAQFLKNTLLCLGVAESGDEKGAGCLKLRFNSSRFSATPVFLMGETSEDLRRLTMVILVMGVSGSGKTTIGQMLAASLHWPFSDADDFHPAVNIEKMSHGIPLTDLDRLPWLEALRSAIQEWLKADTSSVLACSALKSNYRQFLQISDQVKFVYLKGSFDLIQQRLYQRHGHYMKADLLKSQFDTLEEPANALVIDIAQTPEMIVQQIRNELKF